MADWLITHARKAAHLQVALDHDRELESRDVGTGFDRVHFMPRALPEINLSDVDPAITIFGRRLSAPILISSMTGGTAEAGLLNRVLAEAAQQHRLAMALGSGRILLENPRALASFDVRPYAPDVLLFANLGAVQLNRGVTLDDCRRLVAILDADGLVFHLNAVQEALQAEGDTSFGGLLERIAEVASGLGAPVVVKEIGFGLAPDMVRLLLDAGVAAVDVAGAGGTSWSLIEGERAEDEWRAEVCRDLAEWGLPTAVAIQLARARCPDALIFASGGVRTGLDVAKAIALGADLVGIARPFLQVAGIGPEATDSYAHRLVEGLRVAMFGIGARRVIDVKRTDRLILDHLREPDLAEI